MQNCNKFIRVFLKEHAQPRHFYIKFFHLSKNIYPLSKKFKQVFLYSLSNFYKFFEMYILVEIEQT